MSDHRDEDDRGRIPEPAAALGYLGALPFVVCATAIWLGEASIRDEILTLMTALGAVLLAFMGGVRWGLAMEQEDGPSFTALGISVSPPIVAGVVLLITILFPLDFLAIVAGLSVLVTALLALLWSDIVATRYGEAPRWYPGLRIPLTALVVASLIASLVRVILLNEVEPLGP